MKAESILHVLAFCAGAIVVMITLTSAVRTFVVTRGVYDFLTWLIFRTIRHLFVWRLWRTHSYAKRDRVMSFFAPLGLLALPGVWLTLVLVGYTLMFWALGEHPLEAALYASGSSLLTLGFRPVHGVAQTLLAFSEAMIGLTLLALLISYLPTMYAAFARRETAVTLLETRAGSPPSPLEILVRLHAIGQIDRIGEMWESWQLWFADISESHTTLAPLVFYRSPRPDRSWVTAAGAILDTAALAASTLDRPRDPEAELCIRAGYLCLRQIADLLAIPYTVDPHFPRTPISVTRAEYDDACDELIRAGITLKPDRDQSWQDFAGWRVNYDAVLLALAGLIMAPPAMWSSDRVSEWHLPIIPRRPVQRR